MFHQSKESSAVFAYNLLGHKGKGVSKIYKVLQDSCFVSRQVESKENKLQMLQKQ